jgi:hypothetical protein
MAMQKIRYDTGEGTIPDDLIQISSLDG